LGPPVLFVFDDVGVVDAGVPPGPEKWVYLQEVVKEQLQFLTPHPAPLFLLLDGAIDHFVLQVSL